MVDDTTSNDQNGTALDALSKLGAQLAKNEELMKGLPQIKFPEEFYALGESMMKLQETINPLGQQQSAAFDNAPVRQPEVKKRRPVRKTAKRKRRLSRNLKTFWSRIEYFFTTPLGKVIKVISALTMITTLAVNILILSGVV